MNILVSACLMGIRCRYDGSAVFPDTLGKLPSSIHPIPVCPEVFGGMPTPRSRAERLGNKLLDVNGVDVTEFYRRGAEDICALATRLNVKAAILKERSPSCGHGVIYDGTFSSRKTAGDGVLAEMLAANGIKIFGESETAEISAFFGGCREE